MKNSRIIIGIIAIFLINLVYNIIINFSFIFLYQFISDIDSSIALVFIICFYFLQALLLFLVFRMIGIFMHEVFKQNECKLILSISYIIYNLFSIIFICNIVKEGIGTVNVAISNSFSTFAFVTPFDCFDESSAIMFIRLLLFYVSENTIKIFISKRRMECV